jgi:hypothetical protein
MSLYSVENFNEFYIENKDLLSSVKVANLSIDDNAFQKWVNNHPKGDLRKVAQILKDNTRYVSYSEYLNKLRSICEDLAKFLKDKKYTDVVFIISDRIDKSNFWTGLLVYGFLKENQIDVNYVDINFTDKELYSCNFYKNLKHRNPNTKIAYVFADDASYSGLQFSFNIDTLPCYGSFFFVLPYYSNTAKKVIEMTVNNFIEEKENNKEEYGGVDFFLPRNSVNFKTLKEVVEELKKPSLLTSLKSKVNFNKFMIFFNHKLPDMVSIYQTIYALGCNLQNKLPSNRFESLIKGCDYNNAELLLNFSKEDNNICLVNDLHSIFKPMCPEPFYKTIQYKYNQNIITNASQFMKAMRNKSKKYWKQYDLNRLSDDLTFLENNFLETLSCDDGKSLSNTQWNTLQSILNTIFKDYNITFQHPFEMKDVYFPVYCYLAKDFTQFFESQNIFEVQETLQKTAKLLTDFEFNVNVIEKIKTLLKSCKPKYSSVSADFFYK